MPTSCPEIPGRETKVRAGQCPLPSSIFWASWVSPLYLPPGLADVHAQQHPVLSRPQLQHWLLDPSFTGTTVEGVTLCEARAPSARASPLQPTEGRAAVVGHGDKGVVLASFLPRPRFLLTAQLRLLLALPTPPLRASQVQCPHSASSGFLTRPTSGPAPGPLGSVSTWEVEETNIAFPSSFTPGRLSCCPQLSGPLPDLAALCKNKSTASLLVPQISSWGPV